MELRVFTFYPKSTNLTNQVDPSSLPAVVPPNLFPAILTKFMAPIVKILLSHINTHLNFRDFNFLGHDKLLYTMDITSLYTVVPNDEGLLALKHSSIYALLMKPSYETLLRQAELVPTLNWFSFGRNYHKQTNGVAKGTKMGPSYANFTHSLKRNIYMHDFHS